MTRVTHFKKMSRIMSLFCVFLFQFSLFTGPFIGCADIIQQRAPSPSLKNAVYITRTPQYGISSFKSSLNTFSFDSNDLKYDSKIKNSFDTLESSEISSYNCSSPSSFTIEEYSSTDLLNENIDDFFFCSLDDFEFDVKSYLSGPKYLEGRQKIPSKKKSSKPKPFIEPARLMEEYVVSGSTVLPRVSMVIDDTDNEIESILESKSEENTISIDIEQSEDELKDDLEPEELITIEINKGYGYDLRNYKGCESAKENQQESSKVKKRSKYGMPKLSMKFVRKFFK